MKRKVKLTESDLKNIVSILIEQENDEYVDVPAQRYQEIMKYAGYNSSVVARIPEFNGKKIRIIGSLDLSDTPTTFLKNVVYISGALDISRTKVSDLQGIQITGNVWDRDTPIERLRLKKIRQKKEAEISSRRSDDEWDLKKRFFDEESRVAHAIFDYLRNDIDELTEEDRKRLVDLENIIENLEEKEREYDEQGKDTTDILQDIEAAQEESDELRKKIDVYNLVPTKHLNYGLMTFEVVSEDDHDGEEYCAGTYDEVEKAVKEYAWGLLDDGLDNFNKDFLERHIDTEEVVDYFEQFYEDEVRGNLDVYFDEDDYELDEEKQKRLEEIESLIDVLNNRQEELEDQIEEPTEYRKAYDELQSKIDALEEEKDDIESEEGEVSEEKIEERVQEKLDEVRNDPIEALKGFGMYDSLKNFINKRELIDSVVDEDGFSIISHYDGQYHEVYVEDELYYVIRIS